MNIGIAIYLIAVLTILCIIAYKVDEIHEEIKNKP